MDIQQKLIEWYENPTNDLYIVDWVLDLGIIKISNKSIKLDKDGDGFWDFDGKPVFYQYHFSLKDYGKTWSFSKRELLSAYKQKIRTDAFNECINIIENCVWKDSDMLVELIKEQLSDK